VMDATRGKSTLSKVLAGHPPTTVPLARSPANRGRNLLMLDPEQRARIVCSWVSSTHIEIPGVSNLEFCGGHHAAAQRAGQRKTLTRSAFEDLVRERLEVVQIETPRFLERSVNEASPGGAKKRNEILQMALLDAGGGDSRLKNRFRPRHRCPADRGAVASNCSSPPPTNAPC